MSLRSTIRVLGPCALALLLGGAAQANERVLTDFGPQSKLRWQTVNDDVMGGRSQGGSRRTTDGTLLFSGRTSLENRGGFSSIRTEPTRLDLGGYDGLALRVRGDGRTYKLALRTARTTRWIAYWADFETTDGEWVDVRVPFSAFVPTTFGQKLPGPRLRIGAIDSIGFMIYDKKAGPFSLEVDRIAAYSGPEQKEQAPEGPRPILDTARSAGSFSTLLTAAAKAGLVEALSGPGPLTVLAPTDEAFAALPPADLAALLEPANRARLQAVLQHHIIPGDAGLEVVASMRRLRPLSGQRLAARFAGSALRVGEATVVKADIRCSNGTIHVIDRVLLPETRDSVEVAAAAGAFETLLAAARAAGLVPALTGSEPLTILAPTDEAFAALPDGTVEALLAPERRDLLRRILLHHVVPGRVYADEALAAGTAKTLAGTEVRFGYGDGGLKVAGVRLVQTDIATRNGTIHVIDRVLLPPGAQLPSMEQTRIADAAAARARIERALHEGVPRFNRGDHAGCRDVYAAAVRTLIGEYAPLFSSDVSRKLGASLKAPVRDERGTRHAWQLRYALDAAHAELRRSAFTR